MSVSKFGSSKVWTGSEVLKGVDKNYVDHNFLSKHGGVMKADIDMSSHRIFNLPPPGDVHDPVTKHYVQKYTLMLSPTGWNSKNNKIVNVKDPEASSDCANKNYVDSQVNDCAKKNYVDGQIDLVSNFSRDINARLTTVRWDKITIRADVYPYSEMTIGSFSNNFYRIKGVIGIRSGKERKDKNWDWVAELPEKFSNLRKKGTCYKKYSMTEASQIVYYVELLAFDLFDRKIYLKSPITNAAWQFEFDYLFQQD